MRHVLPALAVCLLLASAGCAGLTGQPPAEPHDLEVRNEANATYTVEVAVVAERNETVTRKNATLAPGESTTFADAVPGTGPYMIRATAGNRTETWLWTVERNDAGGLVTVETGGDLTFTYATA
ncbi:hypothetical protein [Halospeciosus flavus]|uniref:Ig-like domain-containing protein n=1 Tax=Halospeciosus flavus TaxID=3032283 RepID=A0ABD5Z7H4_9EURY|nr:hypothetical protein [Halospeciosus flavus]